MNFLEERIVKDGIITEGNIRELPDFLSMMSGWNGRVT